MNPLRRSTRMLSRIARPLAAATVILSLVAMIHLRSLHYGLFLDDWPHVQQLKAADWSLRGLTDACRLELVGGILDVWWLSDFTLRFFRPVAFGLMKLAYVLSDWSPVVMHAVSISWHLLVCVLLLSLLRLCGVAWSIRVAVTALFAIHPAHVATVQWIACQSELIVTALLLGATIATLRCFGWNTPVPSVDSASAPPAPARSPSGASRLGWALLALLCYVLALGSRENAVMFPLLLVIIQPWRSSFRSERPAAPNPRWWVGPVLFVAATLIIAAIYAAFRWHYLAGAALPPRPYVIPPGAPDFLPYVVDKFCYYLLGEFLMVPCVPIGGLDFVRQHPWLLYGGAAFIVAVLLVTLWKLAHQRPGPLGPAWLALFVAPVLPAFESPHHLYLPSIGWAVTVAALCNLSYADCRIGRPRRRSMQVVAWLILLGAGGLYGTISHLYGLGMDAAQRVEDRIVDEALSVPGGIKSGDRLYFANLPVIGHYVGVAIEETAGVQDLHVSALTWAPEALGVQSPTELRQIDRRTVEIHIDGERFFSGLQGQLAAEISGRPSPIDPGEIREHNDMTVELVKRDRAGIKALRFTLDQPLDSPRVHFYWGSQARWANPIRP